MRFCRQTFLFLFIVLFRDYISCICYWESAFFRPKSIKTCISCIRFQFWFLHHRPIAQATKSFKWLCCTANLWGKRIIRLTMIVVIAFGYSTLLAIVLGHTSEWLMLLKSVFSPQISDYQLADSHRSVH